VARSPMTRFAITNAGRIACQALDGLDHGDLYMLQQINGYIAWHLKRCAPQIYAKTVGKAYRLLIVCPSILTHEESTWLLYLPTSLS